MEKEKAKEKKKKLDETIRVDKYFKKEIEEIQKSRLKRLIDTITLSSRKITQMIIRHGFWKEIKNEIINEDISEWKWEKENGKWPKKGSQLNKKGMATANLFLFIILAFVVVVLIGTFLYCHNLIATSITDSGIQSVGAVNLTEASENTIGQINTSMLNYANVIAIFFLFAMVFAMLLIAYVTRDKNPAIFFVMDILIIIFAYILAVYITYAYEVFLAGIPFGSIFTTNLNYATSFLLLLPKITVIVGLLTMIISYSAIPKTKEEEVAGF